MVVALLLAQIYFVNFIFPQNSPDLIMVGVVVWTAIFGFNNSWLWVVIIGLLADLLLLKPLGFFVILYIIIAYLFNFLSARLWTENRWSGFFTLSIFFIFVILFSELYIGINFDKHNLAEIYYRLTEEFFDYKTIIVNVFLDLVFFYGIFYLAKKIS